MTRNRWSLWYRKPRDWGAVATAWSSNPCGLNTASPVNTVYADMITTARGLRTVWGREIIASLCSTWFLNWLSCCGLSTLPGLDSVLKLSGKSGSVSTHSCYWHSSSLSFSPWWLCCYWYRTCIWYPAIPQLGSLCPAIEFLTSNIAAQRKIHLIRAFLGICGCFSVYARLLHGKGFILKKRMGWFSIWFSIHSWSHLCWICFTTSLSWRLWMITKKKIK